MYCLGKSCGYFKHEMTVLPNQSMQRSALGAAVDRHLDAPTRAPAAPTSGHFGANPVRLSTSCTGGTVPQPPTGPAALGSRRIGAAASGRRVLGPLARPITRLEPAVPSASALASRPAAQPPPRSVCDENS
jgi:hypothetical protein